MERDLLTEEDLKKWYFCSSSTVFWLIFHNTFLVISWHFIGTYQEISEYFHFTVLGIFWIFPETFLGTFRLLISTLLVLSWYFSVMSCYFPKLFFWHFWLQFQVFFCNQTTHQCFNSWHTASGSIRGLKCSAVKRYNFPTHKCF